MDKIEPNNNYKTKKYFKNRKNSCEYIMLHHTWAWSENFLLYYLSQHPAQVSCHYVVGRKGVVYQLAQDRQCTWHAGLSQRDWRRNMNYYSIGIEIVSDGYSFTDEQRISTRNLINLLMDVHKIDNKKIIRHKDVAQGRKRDIGDNFWNPYFKSFDEYQKSYCTMDLTIEEQDRLETILEKNWQNRHKSKNKKYKKLLNSISTKIRSYKKTLANA